MRGFFSALVVAISILFLFPHVFGREPGRTREVEGSDQLNLVKQNFTFDEKGILIYLVIAKRKLLLVFELV